jgi:hypothetical protein
LPVVVDLDAVEDGRVGASGADAGELGLEHLDCLGHLMAIFGIDVV